MRQRPLDRRHLGLDRPACLLAGGKAARQARGSGESLACQVHQERWSGAVQIYLSARLSAVRLSRSALLRLEQQRRARYAVHHGALPSSGASAWKRSESDRHKEHAATSRGPASRREGTDRKRPARRDGMRPSPKMTAILRGSRRAGAGNGDIRTQRKGSNLSPMIGGNERNSRALTQAKACPGCLLCAGFGAWRSASASRSGKHRAETPPRVAPSGRPSYRFWVS